MKIIQNKWTVCSAFLACLALFSSCASSSLSGSKQENTIDLSHGTMFFVVEGKDLETPSYLMGSIHATPPNIQWKTQDMTSALSKSRVLLVEVDDANAAAISAQYIQEKGLYTPPTNLTQMVGAQLVQQCKIQLQELIPTEVIEKMKPWVLSLSLLQIQLQKWDFDPSLGVDKVYIEQATSQNIPIVGLETIDSQLDIMSTLSEELQKKLLEQSLNTEHNESQLHELFSAWIEGNLQKIEEVTFKDLKNDASWKPFYDAMFDHRNVKMYSKIHSEITQKGSEFIVVGAGHLIGNTGLIKQLQSAGYTVTMQRSILPLPARIVTK